LPYASAASASRYSVARSGAVERVSAMQSKRAIERAEVVVLVLD